MSTTKSKTVKNVKYEELIDTIDEQYPFPILSDDMSDSTTSGAVFLNTVQHTVMNVLQRNFKVHEINQRYGLTEPWWTSTWFKVQDMPNRLAAYDVMDLRTPELEPKAIVEDFEFDASKWVLRLINTIEGYDGRSIVGLSRAIGLPIASIIKENRVNTARQSKTQSIPYLRLYLLRDGNYMDSRHREIVQLLASYENTNPDGIVINQHREFSLTEIVAPLKNWIEKNETYKKVGLPPRMITIPTYHNELAAVQQGFPISTIFDSFENIRAILGRACLAGTQLEEGLTKLYPQLEEVYEPETSASISEIDNQPIVIPDWLRKKK